MMKQLKKIFPVLILTICLVSVFFISILLFQWINSSARIENLRLERNLDNSIRQIQNDILLEFSAISALFLYETSKKALSENLIDSTEAFPAVYEKWQNITRFPELIQKIYISDFSNNAIYHYDDHLKKFSHIENGIPEYITQINNSQNKLLPYSITHEKDKLLFSIPIDQRINKNIIIIRGFFYIEINRQYFAEKMVANLFNTYFETQHNIYNYALSDEKEELILSASLPMTYNKLQKQLSKGVDRKEYITQWGNIKNVFITELKDNYLNTEFPFERKNPFLSRWYAISMENEKSNLNQEEKFLHKPPKRELFNGDGDSSVILYIWHSSGSIKSAVTAAQNSKLLFSYAVLFAFAAAAVILYLLYRRAKKLHEKEHLFISTVTHELRTPISAMQAVSDNLAEGIITNADQVQEYGKALLDHNRRLGTLIDQILLYSGLNEKRADVVNSAIDFETVIKQITDSNSEIIEKRLIIHLESKLSNYVGNKIAIETIIRNLLNNAFKHNDNSTTVTLHLYIKTKKDKKYLIIRISDTGNGIQKNELSKLKDPFYRGKNSQKQQIQGSGLGLTLVQKIVDFHNGTFRIDSSIENGTNAVVKLPYTQEL